MACTATIGNQSSSFRRCAIGHGNNPSPRQDYGTALKEAKTKSPQEEALANASLKTLNWADKGDYTDPKAGGLFVNYADPAMRRAHRSLAYNAGGQGVFALGTPDPNQLAMSKQNLDDENTQSDAAQYESDVKSGVMNAAGYAGDEAKLDQSRRMGILDTTAGTYKADMNRPKWWQALASGAGMAGAALAGNPAVFA